MPVFPLLKTGAVAQYPLDRTSAYLTGSVQFLNGTVQTFPVYSGPLRKWSIQLANLDESEMDAVISFAEAVEGSVFSFTDPVTGATVQRCIISGDRFDAGMERDLVGTATLTIEEVR